MGTPPLRLLVVEDSTVYASLIKRSLSNSVDNFVMDFVGCVADAEKRLVSAEFDLVLLDLNLPDASGLTACWTLRKHVPEVPIVILTGIDDEELAVSAVKSGAQDYLCKDKVDREHLIRAIRLAVARHCRSPAISDNLLPTNDGPAWRPEARELTFAGVLIKQLSRPAANQERILAAF